MARPARPVEESMPAFHTVTTVTCKSHECTAFGRLFVKPFDLSDRCLSVLSPLSQFQDAASVQTEAHVHCGQTAGWIRMPLGTEVGLSPGNTVLDGAQLHPMERGTATLTPRPLFGPCLLWPNAWVDYDASWYGGTPWPRPHC